MTSDELREAVARRMGDTYYGGPVPGIELETDRLWLRVADEAIRLMEFSRRQLVFGDAAGSIEKLFPPLTLPPDGWQP